jgi:hypothetical protein
MGLKEKIENHPLVWFLSALLAGFLAGIATYKAILEIAQLEVVPKQSITVGNAKSPDSPKTQEKENKKYKVTLEEMGMTEIIPELNIALGFFGTEHDYDATNKAAQLVVMWPKKVGAIITPDNLTDDKLHDFKQLWVESKSETQFSLSHLGQFSAQITDVIFNSTGEPIRLKLAVYKSD